MAEKGKTGVFKDWIEGPGLENVCKWAKLGLSDEQIAKNMGIGRTSFYTWQKKFPDFAAAIKKAKRVPELEIENAMFELACGHVYVEEIKSIIDPKNGEILKIEKIRRQVPPSPAMLIFLAKNRMRDRYKDYAPVPVESNEKSARQDVQIYIPDNRRDEK